MPSKDKLLELRNQIDAIDLRIQELISERAQCAKKVAEVKQNRTEATSHDDRAKIDSVYYRAEREASVLRKVKERNKGPLSDEEMARLFREIMSACLAVEEKLKVAFLGPEGTFTQTAALKHFGHSVDTLPLASIDEVFREVESGAAHYGVVPVENSTEGVVNHTLDMFTRTSLNIVGEVELRIHHHLLGKEIAVQDVQRVYSHQQSLAQCREWLDVHLPYAERISVSSNAEAARRASREDQVAAIAGESAAAIYDLKVLTANIEDEPDNTTRFLVIGRHSVEPSDRDKTSLLISTENRAGALYQLLAPFVQHKISMTRIESRPSRRGMWDYVFYIDIEGHTEDPKVMAALDELRKSASIVKILGSYPCAVL